MCRRFDPGSAHSLRFACVYAGFAHFKALSRRRRLTITKTRLPNSVPNFERYGIAACGMVPTRTPERRFIVARRLSIKLKVHQGSGRFYKTIGKALGRDGLPKPKTFYFDPTDEGAAVTRVMELKAAWKAIRKAGKTVWDEDPTYIAERTSGDGKAADGGAAHRSCDHHGRGEAVRCEPEATV